MAISQSSGVRHRLFRPDWEIQNNTREIRLPGVVSVAISGQRTSLRHHLSQEGLALQGRDVRSCHWDEGGLRVTLCFHSAVVLRRVRPRARVTLSGETISSCADASAWTGSVASRLFAE